MGESSSVEWLKIFPTSGSIPSHYISTLKSSRVQIPFGLSNFNVFYLVVILPAIHNFSNSWIGEGEQYLWWSQFCRMAEIFAPPSYLSVLRSWRVTIPFIQQDFCKFLKWFSSAFLSLSELLKCWVSGLIFWEKPIL